MRRLWLQIVGWAVWSIRTLNPHWRACACSLIDWVKIWLDLTIFWRSKRLHVRLHIHVTSKVCHESRLHLAGLHSW